MGGNEKQASNEKLNIRGNNMSSKGVNKVILIGNLGQDPDMRYMPNGNAVANVTLATSESWKDKNTGEQLEKTEWHRIVFFCKLGEIVGQYCKKGSKIYIAGKLQTRKWQDNNGQDRYTTEIVADQMQMLDSKGGGSAAFDNYRPAQQPSQTARAAAPMPDIDFNDSIPF